MPAKAQDQTSADFTPLPALKFLFWSQLKAWLCIVQLKEHVMLAGGGCWQPPSHPEGTTGTVSIAPEPVHQQLLIQYKTFALSRWQLKVVDAK